jgi:ubiquinone/menaquinone biosynthesis C-methylase UbiE/uncharacterized protein YbaR (Trm112 family)
MLFQRKVHGFMTENTQDKQKEIQFFDAFAQEYNVFSDATNERLMNRILDLMNVRPGSLVVDLGCGSGAFTNYLHKAGHIALGLDISHGIMASGRRRFPHLPFVAGDVEHLPFQSAAFDAVLLSGVIHHFPDPGRFAKEVFRVLKPGGCFVAFDPNRRNPFMYLYRDRSSPLYSSKGVTENERPVLAEEVVSTFAHVGFAVTTKYQSKMHYNYVASGIARCLLPVYNFLDSWLFEPSFMARFRPFVLTIGTKPAVGESLTLSPPGRSADGISQEALTAWPGELMELLVCPISGERLRHEGPWLVNEALQIRYPIRDGIPMLLEQARQGPNTAGKAA